MKIQSLVAVIAVTVSCAFVGSAAALPISVGDGWHTDQVDAESTPSENSPLEFTLLGPAVLSIVDCCLTTDTYELIDSVTSDVLLTTAPGILPRYWTNLGDPSESDWDNSDLSKGQLVLGAGTYSINVIDIISAPPTQYAAGFSFRLDSATPAPEPASLSLLGAGLASLATRRLRKRK